jgi:hypothetical protein
LYNAKYLMENEKPFDLPHAREKLSFRRVRWVESIIMAGIALASMIVIIAVFNVL